MIWPLPLIIGVLVPLVGQLAAYVVVSPSRVSKDRLLVWVPVVGCLLLASQRAVPRTRRVAAIAVGAAGSYAAVALLALVALLSLGERVAMKPAVKAVRPGSPAAAVIEVGDRLDRAQGTVLDGVGGPSLAEIVEGAGGEPVVIDIVREGKARRVEVTPVRDERGALRIGIEMEMVEVRASIGLARAAGRALVEPARRAAAIASGLWRVIGGSAQAEVMGPVGIRDALQRVRDLDVMLLFAVYGLVLLLPLVLLLALVAFFTRDNVAA